MAGCFLYLARFGAINHRFASTPARARAIAGLLLELLLGAVILTAGFPILLTIGSFAAAAFMVSMVVAGTFLAAFTVLTTVRTRTVPCLAVAGTVQYPATSQWRVWCMKLWVPF